MKKVLSLLTGAAVALSLTVSGCAAQTPNTLAVVAGERITDAGFEQTVKNLESHTPADKRANIRQAVVQTLVQAALLERGGRDKHVTVPEATRGKLREDFKANNPFLGEPALAGFTEKLVTVQAYVATLKEKAADLVQGYPVEVNPRFGVWNAERVAFDAPEVSSSSLSQPFPVVTATAER